MLVDHPVVKPNENLVQNLQDKSSNARIKHEIPTSKVVEPPRFNGTIHLDPLEASSSVTSYGLDASALQQHLSIPNFGLDGDVQSHPRNNLPLSTAMDVTPDTLLSRGFDSGKEFQNVFSNYNGAPGDMEAELSAAAAMNSQSFGVPNIPFKSGCSNDVPMNDPAVLGGGIWPTQAPRIRTYTKVQKRGSVGRCIDVTRYKGYDELRRDLARMFGIEGQLEDPQRTDWKLVYVDHESDILLVGDDPWDEFVNCVQSIKILSTGEVQQMSLDGDLGNAPIMPNQASSGTDSGNLWRGHYEDNSAASFNR